jgi:hypothetical protein
MSSIPYSARVFCAAVLVSTAWTMACGGSDSPPTPVAPTPTPTVTAVQVRPSSGDATAPLAPGDTRQLVATAMQSDGRSIDVTGQATWTSSAPAIATISASGLVTAIAEGDVDLSATYQTVRASLVVGVRPVRCAVAITPGAASYGPFGGSGDVDVSVSGPSCRWTARSETSWLPFAFESPNPGGGRFSYAVPPNSTTAARTAMIIVTSSTGDRATQAITQDKTSGCSYVTQPEEAVFTAAGGTGQFNVIATPSDCRWNLVNGMSALGVSVTSGFSGTGNGLVRYTVQAHTRTVDADGYLEIAGLSGQNPNGRFRIVTLKR